MVLNSLEKTSPSALGGNVFFKLFNTISLFIPYIKDTTESDISASYLDILLNIDFNDGLTTTLYDRRDDYATINFPFLCGNVHFHLFMMCTSAR